MDFEYPPEPTPAPAPPADAQYPAQPAKRRPNVVVLLIIAVLLVAAGLAALALRDDDDDAAVVGAPAGEATSTTAAGGGPRSPGTEGQVSPAQRRVFDDLMDQVAKVRGLEWRGPLDLEIVSNAELARLVQESTNRDVDPVQLAAEEATLKLLGLIPDNLDYKKLIDDLLAEQVLGFYDPETKELFVGSDGGNDIDSRTRWVIAHEMTHALTDQVFGYGPATIALDKEDRAEELAAYSALLEGDATLAQTLWAQEHLSPAEQAALLLGGGESGVAVFLRAPQYIQRALFFPYNEGQTFVQGLYEDGGWAAVDAAYRNPPTSTEHILDPATYRARQPSASPPLPDVASASGCSGLRTGILGQFDMRALLDEHLTATEAGRAAEGWNGDAFSLVRCGSTLGFVDRWRTDGNTEATRLVEALNRWAGPWAGSRTTTPAGDGRFSGPSGAGRIVRNGNTVDLVLAENAETVDRLARALAS
ncbi:MAG TPA: hypothetical protein VF045_07490 [Acidimicrobiales bacterium]